MKPYHRTYTPLTPDPNGVCEDQTAGGAGNLTLNGALVSGGVATMSDGLAHQLSIESTGNLSGVTFTVTGTDSDGHALVEAVTGPNATTVETSGYFLTVTQIAVDGAVGTNVEIGPVDEAAGPTRIVDFRSKDFEAALGLDISGTINADVEVTLDPVFSTETTTIKPQQDCTWQNHSVLAGVTATTNDNLEYSPTAIRLVINSYTAGAVISIHQIDG